MDPRIEQARLMNRRSFMKVGTGGIGLAALWSLLGDDLMAAGDATETGGLPGLPHFAPKAKRVIYLYMLGAPSPLDLWDYKPKLKGLAGTNLPDSVRGGQRLTGFTANQATLPIVPSAFTFKQYGQSGQWVSELMPHHGQIVDDICFVRTMSNDQINHDPAISMVLTGFQLAGRPTLGAWTNYALGSVNKNLPGFIAFVSESKAPSIAAHDRMWGSGFLPPRYGGVKFGASKDPVLYLSNPEGIEAADRRRFLDGLAALNETTKDEFRDPEINNRIEQYELAAKMQVSVPELTDLSKEPDSTFELYGEESRAPGTFARNCLLARRLAERGVRFIQLTHRSWDHHNNLPKLITEPAHDVDQASAALIQDLKQKGMLDETLVMWGGEFGRTVYGQAARPGEVATNMTTSYGRDHHVRCYTIWMAGGGIKPGISYGETDDFNYNTVKDPVSIHDRHATVLHCLGIDHKRLTYKHQGRDFRLTDVSGNVVKGILA
jgi:hypothetical protein